MNWETVIGMEVHAQLSTDSKIFSGASTAFGAEPNSQACAVDLGLPGALPVVNIRAVEMAVKFGLAVNGRIASHSIFARKNYFYPDLPKGYQISQYEDPIVSGGVLPIDFDGGITDIQLTRAHLEEDAGKSAHGNVLGATGIDLNRAGTALLEIVSEPVMRSAKEAVAYLRELHQLVQYLKICDGNMEEGSFRCDANVSVRLKGDTELGTRTEIKNLNSFRFVERAIDFEVERQIDVLTEGGSIAQETRLYDTEAGKTRSMRGKEDAHDYRYFPDPDLLPVHVAPEFIEELSVQLPELPRAKRQRFVTDYELSQDDASLLTGSAETAAYFEACLAAEAVDPKALSNWIVGELFAALNEAGLKIENCPIKPADFSGLIERISDGTISGKMAKEVFQAMWDGEGNADEVIDARGLEQISDSAAIEAAVDEVIAENSDQAAQFRAGKEKVLGFLVGQVMKKTKGQANPKVANELMRKQLGDGE